MIRILGRYELLEQVGSGGMAVVYRGRDSALDREVAVKLLHPHLASSAESRARFSREARAVARLSHPGIVEIYDYAGDAAPEAYLVTEFVRGRTLRVYAHEVGFGFPEVGLLVGRALADALVHAHSAGVIHRDLKPENVLVHEAQRPALKLADFGIARILASDERMTMTGALVGSPHHMAPEIVEGREADARSDVFSLGTILYWLATGKLPFAASNPTAILRRVLEGDFVDPREAEPRVPDAAAALISRALALDPAARPASAAEVRDALDAILADVGIDRPGEAVGAFLSAPDAFKAAFPERAVASLVSLGDAALAQGSPARALAHYSHVLAIDPANAAVPAKLARLARRRRARRAAKWTGLSLGAAALLAVAVALAAPRLRLLASGPDGRAPATASPPTLAPRDVLDEAADAGASAVAGGALPDPSPAQVAGETGADAGEGGGEAPAGDAPRRHGAESQPPALQARALPPPPSAPLSIHVRPYAERALLDGVEVARGAQQVRFSLAPGRTHVIQIEHACCAPFVREITAEEAAQVGELRVPLTPRPARVRVEGDPAARVYVDGALLGTAGDSQRTPFHVAIPTGGDSPYEASARIVVQPAAAPARVIQVRLRAGAEVTVASPQDEVEP